ncbi:pyruvate decarboxylase [Hyaloscypha bicolor E]|uniref:Pyruvate decarboxylase n=1 Tax=Hyaloscypha bicolor E TaxID=1095630 RepID=A0A2J6TUU5_9HELO|nr:pyruvate decarboxylase [Hyaloscypha bicolor E]PMD66728.1 pyruvate decarboxylase [Hyaloscypha bicolor E]
MGLPGDTNLELLHYIGSTDMHWVGNSNELNAAYAADGYSRIKGCPGVILTTMGVGELSAINGIAGSFAENVKIIHVVTATGRAAQEKRVMIHHTLGDSPDHRIYAKISSPVRVAHCYLDDENTAVAGIDRVIRECYIHSRPVYIYVPVDMAHKPVAASALDKPLLLTRPSETTAEQAAVDAVLGAIHSSKNPVVLVDSLILQLGLKPLVRSFLNNLKFPTFCPFMGKSVIEERKPYFRGTYNGKFSYPGVQKAVEEDSDLVIHIGPLPTDMNTGGFSAKIDPKKLILLQETKVIFKGELFVGVYLESFLTRLSNSLDISRVPKTSSLALPALPPLPSNSEAKDPFITQSHLWPRIGKFFRAHDIIFSDGGTCHFGLQDAEFPDITYIMQNHWASIGYALPATFGGAIAKRDLTNSKAEGWNGVKGGGDGRVIFITGEGAMQLTVQEVGSMIREQLDVIIIIINNGGYSIERCVVHPDAAYHDIATWNHKHMLDFFGAEDGAARTYQVRTKVELEAVLTRPELEDPQGVHVLEIFTDKMDFPWRLKAFGEAYREMKGT